MLVKAWNNGDWSASGAGYGVKLRAENRDAEFSREWISVEVLLPNGTFAVCSVSKPSFWSPTCRELVSKDIGRWLIADGLAPWPKGHPPELELKSIGDRTFELTTAGI